MITSSIWSTWAIHITNSEGHNKRTRWSTKCKQNDVQNPVDYAKHHQTGHFIHLTGGNRACEHSTLTYFVYKCKTHTIPRKTSDNMGRKRYFCSHCNDFVSRSTRSRHLKKTCSNRWSFLWQKQQRSTVWKWLGRSWCIGDNLEYQSGQDNCSHSSNSKASNLSCDRKW